MISVVKKKTPEAAPERYWGERVLHHRCGAPPAFHRTGGIMYVAATTVWLSGDTNALPGLSANPRTPSDSPGSRPPHACGGESWLAGLAAHGRICCSWDVLFVHGHPHRRAPAPAPAAEHLCSTPYERRQCGVHTAWPQASLPGPEGAPCRGPLVRH
jgi:hypothetical protein